MPDANPSIHPSIHRSSLCEIIIIILLFVGATGINFPATDLGASGAERRRRVLSYYYYSETRSWRGRIKLEIGCYISMLEFHSLQTWKKRCEPARGFQHCFSAVIVSSCMHQQAKADRQADTAEKIDIHAETN